MTPAVIRIRAHHIHFLNYHRYIIIMPLFQSSKSDKMSTDPQLRQAEKTIAKEAQGDQKALDHANKDLSGAEKTHSKSLKV